MRIEELKNGNYVKTPDKAEKELLNVVNRFFNSDMEDFDKSKESIILEVQRRLKPLIINLVKRIAWEEGREIFEPMIDELVDKIISEEVGNLQELINSIKTSLLNHKEYIVNINNATTKEVVLPVDYVVVYGSDVMKVKVNGVEQIDTINYDVVLSDKFVRKIAFKDYLEDTDVVGIECWIYNDIGGTS